MSQKRFTTQEKVMNVEITQDENNPAELQITATNTMANIVEMKIALGEDIDLAYFEENGENLPITEGKTVTASYTLSQNSTVNVYVKDEDGYTYLYTKTIIGIDEPLPPQVPIISLSQNETNPKQIDVVVRGLDAYIRRIKWAEGERDTAFFETNGTQIETDTIGKIIQTEFLITKTGTYTVYAIDNNGNETVETITVTNIDETPEIDREKPIITGVTEGSIYQEQVVPEVTDEHLKEIILLKDGEGDLPGDGEEPGDNHPGDGDQNPDDGNNPGQGNNNHTESGDNSTRPGILPQTGEGMFALGFLFVGIGVCIYFYCRYKKIGR